MNEKIMQIMRDTNNTNCYQRALLANRKGTV